MMSNFILTHLWLISYIVVQFFFVQLYYINFPFSRSLTSFVVGGRMVENSGASAGGGDGDDPPLPAPPPLHPTLVEILRRSEESQQTQNQIMQAIVQHLGGQGHGGQRHGHSAFMATDPPIFCGSEPLDADFLLRTIEQKFDLIQCNDQESVNYAAHQLRDAAGVWWHGYKAQVGEGHQVTCAEFCEAFHAYHIPKSILNIKRDEFRKLRQGNKSVMEYVNAFNYLAQYALEDVNTDEKKQDHFMNGLSLKLQSYLSTTDF